MMSIKTVKQITTRQRNPRPTKAQVAAFAHLMQRDGRKSLTKAECEALAGHPGLTIGQRAEFKTMAEDKVQL